MPTMQGWLVTAAAVGSEDEWVRSRSEQGVGGQGGQFISVALLDGGEGGSADRQTALDARARRRATMLEMRTERF